MKIDSLEKFTRGWIIGDFEPSVLRTTDFEVGILHHNKGEYIAPHRHDIATEYNVLVSGHMLVNGKDIRPGDVFILSPTEVVSPTVLEESIVVVVKTPSIPNDKHII